MTRAEQEVRENFILSQQTLKKLNIVRNELIPYYTKKCTLGELEELLWDQYSKFQNNIHKIFEND